MGLFGTILEKLGLGKSTAQAAPQSTPAPAPTAPQPGATTPPKAMAAVELRMSSTWRSANPCRSSILRWTGSTD